MKQTLIPQPFAAPPRANLCPLAEPYQSRVLRRASHVSYQVAIAVKVSNRRRRLEIFKIYPVVAREYVWSSNRTCFSKGGAHTRALHLGRGVKRHDEHESGSGAPAVGRDGRFGSRRRTIERIQIRPKSMARYASRRLDWKHSLCRQSTICNPSGDRSLRFQP